MPAQPMWRRYLRFFGADVRADVNEELEFHIDARARELMEEGVAPAEARRRAERQFGDVSAFRELCRTIGEESHRRATGRQRAADWLRDARHSARALRRTPGFLAVAVLTLAAGLGGVACLFSIVDAWIVRSVRFDKPAELVFVRGLDTRRGSDLGVSYADFADLASHARQAQSLAAWTGDSFTLSREGEPERVAGASVSTNFFEVLRVQPAAGRTFESREGDAGQNKVAIVSHGFWKSRLAGHPDAVGSRIDLNGEPHTIIGILPERFHFTLAGRANVWVPLAPSPAERERRQNRYLELIGRLKPGATAALFREEMKNVAGELAAAYPATNQDIGVSAMLLSEEIARHTGAPVIYVVFAITLGLLLIACSNVTGLLLVRALARKRHAAIQLSLGAGRGRLIRQSLIETGIVFFIAAGAGAGTGYWATGMLTAFIPFENRGYLPDYGQAPFNWTVFAVVFGLAFAAALAFGLAPALETSSASVVSILKESGAALSQSVRAGRLRTGLVVVQVILATVLLSSTIFMVQAFRGIWSGPLGFESANVLTFRLSLDERQYASATQRRVCFENTAAALNGLARDAAVASFIPFSNSTGGTSFRLAGAGSAETAESRRLPKAMFAAVTPGYFAALKIPVLAGRGFSDSDGPDRPLAAIVNAALAAQYFHGRDPVGQLILISSLNQREARIVGVVKDVRMNSDPASAGPQIYVPFAQAPAADAYVVARTSGDPLAILPAARRAVASVDRKLPVYAARSMDALLDEGFAPYRIVSGLLVWFGGLALVLAAVGVYGVVAFSVSQRTREIGIRAALGADRRRLYALFLRQGLWVLLSGLVPGLALAFAATPVLSSVIEQIAAIHPAGALSSAAAVIATIVILATLIPARRVAAVDPVSAIRYE